MIKIRKTEIMDRPEIQSVLINTDYFTVQEIEIAMELVDIYLCNKNQQDYKLYTAVAESKIVAGYICFGKIPLTQGTYDIYWVAVSPEYQGRGIGTLLLNKAEDTIIKLHGNLICIETSSSKKYDSTRRFYKKRGYILESRIRDFYRPGDDRLLFIKYTNSFH